MYQPWEQKYRNICLECLSLEIKISIFRTSTSIYADDIVLYQYFVLALVTACTQGVEKVNCLDILLSGITFWF